MSGTAVSAWALLDGAFVPATVLVEANRITAVATEREERAALGRRAECHVEAEDCWLVPGFVDAHAHGYGALLRGTENSMPLELWALYTTLYGRAFDAGAMRAAILLGAAERIRAGITAWVDHSPMMHLGEAALDAHARSGLRVGWAPFLHDVSDYDLIPATLPPRAGGPAAPLPPLDPDAYAARFGDLVSAGKPARLSVLLGPNAPQRCSPAAWELWRRLRDQHGVAVHTHLMETRAQAALGSRRRDADGAKLVAAMQRENLLDSRLSVAHGIWLTPAEREMLARAGVTLVHNPASNLMLGSGVLPWRETREAGLTVALGTDSANTGGRHDMFEAMRLALMLPRVSGLAHGEWPRAEEVLAMATGHGARALGLGDQLGRIAPGQLADLVLVRRESATTLALEPNARAFVQHAGTEAVRSVMVDGTWLMRDGRFLAFDEAAAISDAQGAIAELRERTRAALPAIAPILPSITQGLMKLCQV